MSPLVEYNTIIFCEGKMFYSCKTFILPIPLQPILLSTCVETWISRSGLKCSRVGLSGVELKLGVRCLYKQILDQALEVDSSWLGSKTVLVVHSPISASRPQPRLGTSDLWQQTLLDFRFGLGQKFATRIWFVRFIGFCADRYIWGQCCPP